MAVKRIFCMDTDGDGTGGTLGTRGTTGKIARAVQASQGSQASHASQNSIFPAFGGYEQLLSYQKAKIIYSGTIKFCERFISTRSRTHDQMIQAARSGKQNIVEGSRASGTSKEMEIKLTNVARASLTELLEDFLDYLESSGSAVWDKNSREALYVRRLGASENISYEHFREFFETRPGPIVANIQVCLIHQATYLLYRQLLQLDREFVANGGMRERMTRIRRENRKY